MRVNPRVWGAGRFLLLLAGLVATFGIFFFASMRMAVQAREVVVPDVRGRSVSEAGAVLTAAGLAFKVDPQRRPDSVVPADHVLAQEPDPGTVLRRQRSVRVRLSEGIKSTIVPIVIGETQRTAELHLTQERITLAGITEIRSADYASDLVVGQDPPARTAAGSVSLLVNRGAPRMSFVMPDLIGLYGDAAAERLRRLGFTVAFGSDTPYPGLPPGVVIKQTPQGGYQVAPGELITLERSR
jgi:serine/threonine-protein kinase